MKVIYAGYAKTGTKTMAAVFNEFGYNTYDFFENSFYLGKDWVKIINEGGTVEDFRRMYKGVDAVLDSPTFIFWEEISEAYPEAKIIFSVRDEESWLRSLEKQVHSHVSEPKYLLMQMLSYSGWGLFRFTQATALVVIGAAIKWPWGPVNYNPTLWKRIYRNHNSNVLQVSSLFISLVIKPYRISLPEGYTLDSYPR
uniref:uncharacterized protein LOC104266268 n=1 Tax=Ciona intestinalis TaxID=7719 RepID=UPI000EF44949|nr:uncharacterized protein LOC104266268 [Ciona intestinalis]|eukprot:XP_009860338.2 uncharacterized protein LOC104266268 [Ciona intestinalis]